MAFKLSDFINGLENNVGRAVDAVVPGNQSNLHKSTPKPPAPASTARPQQAGFNRILPDLGRQAGSMFGINNGHLSLNPLANFQNIRSNSTNLLDDLGAGVANSQPYKTATAYSPTLQGHQIPVGELVKSFVESPAHTVQRLSSLGVDGHQSYNGTPVQMAGQVGEDALNLVTAGRGGSLIDAAKVGGKPALKQIAKVLGEDVLTGGGYGAATTAQDANASAMDYARNIAAGATLAPLAHGVGEAGFAGAGAATKATGKFAKSLGEDGYLAGTNAKGFEKAAEKGKTSLSEHNAQPFFEGSDKDMKFKKSGVDALNKSFESGGTVPLSTLIDHGKLSKDYPNVMNDTKVVLDRSIPRPSQYNYDTNTIHINDLHPENSTVQGLRKSVTHETQHAIDEFEQLPRGTTIEPRLSKADQAIYDKLTSHYQEVGNRVQAQNLMLEQKREALLRQGMDPRKVVQSLQDEASANPDLQLLDQIIKSRQTVAARATKPGADEVATNNYLNNLAEGRAHQVEQRSELSPRQIKKNPVDPAFGIKPGQVADNIRRSNVAAYEGQPRDGVGKFSSGKKEGRGSIQLGADFGKGGAKSPLHEEALKYKNADDFIAASHQPIYHGTNEKFTKFDLKKGNQPVAWFADDPSAIKGSGARGTQHVMERYIPKSEYPGWNEYHNLGLSAGDKSGVIKLPQEKGSYFAVTNTKKLLTKKQLTNIYNEAHASAPQVAQSPLGDAKPNIAAREVRETPKPTEEKTKRAPQSLNTDRLNISEDAKPEVNALSMPEEVTRMTDEQVTTLAKSAGIDARSHTIDQTREEVAKQLNLRQKIVTMTNKADKFFEEGEYGKRAELMKQIQEYARTSTAQGTDIARQLSARRILANELDTPMQRIFKLLEKAGVNPDVSAERIAKVDFNDANDVVKAYRELVPPGKGDWLDTVRYNSMLSSPLTQINNIFPNLLSTAVITPIEKTVTGLIDAAHSAVTGKPRQYAIGEGAAYTKGYFKSLDEAKRRFSESMSGMSEATNLDTKGHVPMFAHGQNKTYDTLSFPMRLMEAMDGFFTGLTEGGVNNALDYREAKGITVRNKSNIASSESAYRLYRQELGDKSQGTFLQGLDIPAQKLMELRNSSNPYVSYPAKFTVPFVRTTMNIFKQGFEYSPAGVLTLHGSNTKTEQVSKMLLGTAVVGAGASLLGQNRLTWSEPTSQKQKEAWKAAGMQPYSVKIGGKEENGKIVGGTWVAFQKLPPAIAFNLALVAALDDAQKNAKINQNGIDNVVEAVAKYGQFLSDQSYTKSAGNFLKAAEGDKQAFTQLISGYPQQLIPFRAFSNWFANMTDTKQRKINTDANFAQKQVEALMMTIPGLRQKTSTIPDPNGNPIPSQHPFINAFSPVKVSTEDVAFKGYYDGLKKQSLDTANAKIEKKQSGTISTGGTKTAEGRVKTAEKSFASSLSKPASQVLTDYAKLDNTAKSSFNDDPAKVYQLHQAQYENNKKNGKLTDVEDFKAKQTLGKEAITSKYSKDVQDFYGLSKDKQTAYFAADRTKATELYDQAKKLDQELNTNKFTTTPKYKYGLGKKPKKAKSLALKSRKFDYSKRVSVKGGNGSSNVTALRKLVMGSKITVHSKKA